MKNLSKVWCVTIGNLILHTIGIKKDCYRN
jgi:hypothetical protein